MHKGSISKTVIWEKSHHSDPPLVFMEMGDRGMWEVGATLSFREMEPSSGYTL